MKQSIQEYLGVPTSWPDAACRVFDVPNAAIGGRWAYIPQRDKNGKYYIARMQATNETQKAIRKFDKDGVMPKAGFTFKPLTPSYFYKAKQKYMKLWQKGDVGGTQKPRGKQNKHRIKTRTIPMNLRTAA